MALFKKRMEAAAAMRLALGATLRRRPEEALQEPTIAASLMPSEAKRLHEELLPLELALWHLRFLEAVQKHRIAVAPVELGRMFGVALLLALQDAGVSTDLAAARGEALIGRMGEYLDGAHASLAEDDRGGPILALCRLLPRRVLPQLDLRQPAARERHFELLNVAMQVNDMQGKFMTSLLKEYRLVNS